MPMTMMTPSMTPPVPPFMQVAPVGPRIRGGLPESTEMWISLIVFAVQKTRNKDFWWDIQILGVYVYIYID